MRAMSPCSYFATSSFRKRWAWRGTREKFSLVPDEFRCELFTLCADTLNKRPNPDSGTWEVIVKRYVSILELLLCIFFAAQTASASTLPVCLQGRKEPCELATHTQLFNAVPGMAAVPGSPTATHLFPVNDAKGLLLTCVAPEIDINVDTDIFNGCTLAPGRTLDDVMHSFIGAFHYIDNEQKKERAEWYKDFEEKSDKSAAQK